MGAGRDGEGGAVAAEIEAVRIERADADAVHQDGEGVLAAVPMLAIFRVSASLPMVIVSPTFMPSVPRRWMVVSPASAGTASPELERPSR